MVKVPCFCVCWVCVFTCLLLLHCFVSSVSSMLACLGGSIVSDISFPLFPYKEAVHACLLEQSSLWLFSLSSASSWHFLPQVVSTDIGVSLMCPFVLMIVHLVPIILILYLWPHWSSDSCSTTVPWVHGPMFSCCTAIVDPVGRKR